MIYRLLLVLLVVFPAAASAQVITPEDVRRAVRQAGGPELFLKEIARQTASQLPVQLNQNVEMMAVLSVGKQIRYQQRLSSVVSRASVHNINALRSANINYATCSSPVMSVLIRDYGVTVTYVALSRNHEYLFEFELNSKICQGR